ncbi:hypothetical protein [Burkholderia pseudomallei]|uniref:hypothetical protein n=1 Tax=Burkholderia pseudomallei TaxID=28450 RepID=UPI0015E096C8|nr:hypothetical protein [Burkholderia pseudomallei]
MNPIDFSPIVKPVVTGAIITIAWIIGISAWRLSFRVVSSVICTAAAVATAIFMHVI